MIVLQLPDEEEARIYFNPEIIKREGTREVEEGCLSYPGYRAVIERSAWIRFGALDHTEKEIKVKAEGLLAQAMEHEVDHLNGILYLDHLSDHTRLYRVDENGEPLDLNEEDSEEDTDGDEAESDSEDAPASMKVT